MKKIITAILLIICLGAKAQSYEVERLILDIQKLAQMKSILTDLYKGYEILNTGYNTIKGISEGNFNLHQNFLNGLLAVSPGVSSYSRIADIIANQASIISEYKSAFKLFQQDKHFNPDEITYLGNLYNSLVSGSLTNLSNLINVITAGKLRMSDAERLHAIDGIYTDTNNKLSFLRQVNNSTATLALQRATDANDVETVQKLYGL